MSVSAVINRKPSRDTKWLQWWPVIAGLLVLYVPTVLHLYRRLWNQDAYAHGPIVLGIILWLFWRAGPESAPRVQRDASWAGWCLFAFGLVTYVLGRSQSIALLDVGSIVPLAAGLILILLGWAGLRRYWFALLFLFFLLPLPPFVIDAVTSGLKPAVSAASETILWHAGYPVARTGVVLNIGQYQLLVADACSGLNSMFALSAIGLLYLYLMGHSSRVRIGIMLVSILPVAFTANIARVVVLMLITYYAGDEAGQNFSHLFAGLMLYMIALVAFIALDSLLGRLPWYRDTTRSS